MQLMKMKDVNRLSVVVVDIWEMDTISESYLAYVVSTFKNISTLWV